MGKRLFIFILCSLTIFLYFWLSSTKTIDSSNYEKLNLQVSGMVCSSCQVKVIEKLKKVPNVISVTANHTTGLVIVVYKPVNSQNTIKEIYKKIDSLGYRIEKPTSKLEVLNYKFEGTGD